MEKRIDVCTIRAGDIKTGFGNPRKITKAKLEELKESLQNHGDFGIFLLDEKDNVISGNQRLKAIIDLYGPDKILDCKRLVGYSKAELRAINIKSNVHAGDWDTDLLADWTADLNIDVGITEQGDPPEERSIPEMELIHYEKYDYVLIACRSELDYNDLVRKLGIEGKQVSIATRKIAARAIWYDEMDAEIVPKEEMEKLRKSYKGDNGGEER